MQSNIIESWLNKRGITNDVIALFNLNTSYQHHQIGECLKIPYSPLYSKYRRHPNDEVKPKYLYDTGGKVTLYGQDKIDWKQPVLISEGELDTLVAWSNNIQSVSSTGGATSFQEEWGPLFKDTKTYICFDNDEAGGRGAVKTLSFIPHAHIVFIPDQPDVKDISDYVRHGGDLIELLATACQFNDTTEVKEDMQRRKATWQSTHFHEAYLDQHQQVLHRSTYTPNTYEGDDELLRAKAYPMENLMSFTRRKALCPFHNESTPSFQYYPKTNSAYCFGCSKYADSVNIYQTLHDCTFKEAVKALNKLV